LIPTSISIDSAKGGWQIGKVSYPQPVTTTLGFQKEPLSVYAGDIQIQIQVKIDADDIESARILPVQLGIQACNDKICLPPEKVALHLPMRRN
jgi:DsbC/DsbD-like thiol-disulfide interchange protein